MLRRGQQVPHFSVRDAGGVEVRYAKDLWQTRNLLLFTFPRDEREAFARYAADLRTRHDEIGALDATAVVTTDEVPGAPRPGVVIADRWGEIHVAVEARDPAGLPAMDELMDWLRYVRHECPECQGETK